MRGSENQSAGGRDPAITPSEGRSSRSASPGQIGGPSGSAPVAHASLTRDCSRTPPQRSSEWLTVKDDRKTS